MNLNPIRRALGLRQKPEYYPPVMAGPPENPEYFILLHKKGLHPKFELEERHYMRNVEEETRQFNLRRAHYISLFPSKQHTSGHGFRRLDTTLNPAHFPKFVTLKKKVNFSEYMMPYVGLGINPNRDVFRLVRQIFKTSIEELNPSLCQFIPFEFRLRTGEVIEKFFIIDFPKQYHAPIVMEKSGAKKTYSRKTLPMVSPENWVFPDEDVVRKGQLIIQRPAATEQHLYFCGRNWWVYSKALAQRLRPHIPAIDEFYPVHVEEKP